MPQGRFVSTNQKHYEISAFAPRTLRDPTKSDFAWFLRLFKRKIIFVRLSEANYNVNHFYEFIVGFGLVTVNIRF